MAEEPEQQDTPEEQDPAEEQEAPEQPAPEEQSTEPAPEEALAEDAATEGEDADEQDSTEAEAAEEQPQADAEEESQLEAAAESKPEAEEKGKSKSDLPPGAELDPIALEPERKLSAEERAKLEAEAEERERLEAEATAESPEEPTTSPTPAQLAGDARYLATGKRKSSIARVTVMPGDGKFEINRRSLQEYFPRPLHQSTALEPLSVTGYEGTVDVRVNVKGGGIGGQAGAVRHGIARALTEIDPQLRGELKRRGFLTRDARVKERRKAGLKKARKRPQFSKR